MTATLLSPAAEPTRSWRDRAVRFVEAATTPLLPADYLDLFAPLRPGADLRGRIVSVEPETRDAATIVIKPGADWAGHVPGQYVRIGIDVDGVRQWRAYSLTHGPRKDGLISITVKAVPDGTVSNHLVHDCPVGTLVHLEQAAGEFVLPDFASAEPVQTKFLFVTAGSGVTPVVGMLRNLFPVTDEGVRGLDKLDHQGLDHQGLDHQGLDHQGLDHQGLDIVVVHVAPSEPDSIFHSNLQDLAASGAIRLVARYDDVHGVLDVDELPALVPDLAERTTYACGPASLLDALEEFHANKGLDLFTEQFRVAVVTPGEGGTVAFANGTVVEADGSTPILDAAEDAGVLMPSGCRMGVCFGCVLPLREGAVRDLRNGEITTAAPGDNVSIQTCISAAAGACHIDH